MTEPPATRGDQTDPQIDTGGDLVETRGRGPGAEPGAPGEAAPEGAGRAQPQEQTGAVEGT